MMGSHQRLKEPQDHTVPYVAGIDLAGEREEDRQTALTRARPKLDSTVITIAQVHTIQRSRAELVEPTLNIGEHYQWTGIPHSQLYPQIVGALKKWNCQKVLVDATGIGQPVASFLRKELGSRVVPFTFTQKSKSDMGFELLSFVSSSRLNLYKQDGSDEYQEMVFQLEKARAQYRPNQTMNFYVDPARGHDDFLMSLALLVEAANQYSPRSARGS
jgi:hypothetical protein